MLTFAILLQTTLLVLRTHSHCNSPFLVASGMFGFSRLDLIVGNVNKSESWKHMGKGGFHYYSQCLSTHSSPGIVTNEPSMLCFCWHFNALNFWGRSFPRSRVWFLFSDVAHVLESSEELKETAYLYSFQLGLKDFKSKVFVTFVFAYGSKKWGHRVGKSRVYGRNRFANWYNFLRSNSVRNWQKTLPWSLAYTGSNFT